MRVTNLTNLSEKEFAELEKELASLNILGKVLTWANAKSKDDFLLQVVAETIQQDEYTHDVIIPFRDLFLVFDTT